MRLLFEVSGDRQIERELLRFGERAGDMTPAFDRIVDLFADETADQFDTAGVHASGGWQPLRPATSREKERLGVNNGILRRTFALEDSLTHRGDPNMLLEVGPDELVWGSQLPYARYHQNPGPGSHLPRRRPIELTEGARRSAVRILQRYLMSGEVAP